MLFARFQANSTLRAAGVSWAILLAITFLSTSATHAGWVQSNSNQPVPSGAVLSGTEQNNSNAGSNLYVCRASFQGGLHPGKLVASWRWCHFGWGGYEQTSSTYDVLVENGTWKTGTTQGALIGGHEADGTLLYICRTRMIIDGIDHGTASGKVVGNTCHTAYGGDEWESSSYSLFYVASAPPHPPSSNLNGAYYFDALSGTQPFEMTVTFTGTWVSGSVSSGQTSFSIPVTQRILPGRARSVFFSASNLRPGTWTVTATPRAVGGPMTCRVTVPGFVHLNVSGGRTSCTPP